MTITGACQHKLGFLNSHCPICGLGSSGISGDGKTAFRTQVGGDHYTKLKIQPLEYSMANKLDAMQHTAIKYVTRCYDKGDPIENIDKAIHTLQLLREYILTNK